MKSNGIFSLFTIIFSLSFSYSGLGQWFWQNPLPQGNSLTAVTFIDANIGFSVGYTGTILRTTDGGNTWESQSSGTINHLCGISFTDSNIGTTVGWNGTILKTTDSGNSWISQLSGTSENLRGV